MIIYALFDSEKGTVAKALPEHEVYSFGIGGGDKHIELDLSDGEAAIKELEKYPKPDVIFASPPCETWVDLSKGHLSKYTKEKGFNLHWKKKWEAFDLLPKFKERRLNGVNTCLAMARIIQHFKPKFWAIENGQKSLLFDYILEFGKLEGHRNLCNYFSYGLNVLKKTIIYSNTLLVLKNRKPTHKLDLIARKKCTRIEGRTHIDQYAERSQVPPELYRDIMRQFEMGGNKTLF